MDFQSDDSFPVKTGSLGQISIIAKSRHILQNETLDVNYSNKLVSRSKKVIKGEKNAEKRPKKVNFFRSSQIIPLNEALDVSFSENWSEGH